MSAALARLQINRCIVGRNTANLELKSDIAAIFSRRINDLLGQYKPSIRQRIDNRIVRLIVGRGVQLGPLFRVRTYLFHRINDQLAIVIVFRHIFKYELPPIRRSGCGCFNDAAASQQLNLNGRGACIFVIRIALPFFLSVDRRKLHIGNRKAVRRLLDYPLCIAVYQRFLYGIRVWVPVSVFSRKFIKRHRPATRRVHFLFGVS